MSLEKSETLDAINEIAAQDAAPKSPPRKRYAAPSAPLVLQCMLPEGAARRTPREKA
jgi:hypothetical protein